MAPVSVPDPRARRRRRRDGARGGVAVEFALVLPLFLAVVFGIIDGGRLMMARWMVSYAVQRGGRVATLRTSTAQNVKDAVAASATLIGLVASNVNVEVNSGATAFTSRASGDKVHVWTTFVFQRKLAFVFVPATINIVANTLSVVE